MFSFLSLSFSFQSLYLSLPGATSPVVLRNWNCLMPNCSDTEVHLTRASSFLAWEIWSYLHPSCEWEEHAGMDVFRTWRNGYWFILYNGTYLWHYNSMRSYIYQSVHKIYHFFCKQLLSQHCILHICFLMKFCGTKISSFIITIMATEIP